MKVVKALTTCKLALCLLKASRQTHIMPNNIEIKARVHDMGRLEARALEITGLPGVVIKQRDTFFRAPNGRLKLRFLENDPSQLIFYVRPDNTGPKHSEYHITETTNPESLQAVLGSALGIRGEVRKTRLLHMIGQTRVHLDRVEGLGTFMELEVVMKADQPLGEGEQIAEDIMNKLGIDKKDLISGAYIDLLEANHLHGKSSE